MWKQGNVLMIRCGNGVCCYNPDMTATCSDIMFGRRNWKPHTCILIALHDFDDGARTKTTLATKDYRVWWVLAHCGPMQIQCTREAMGFRIKNGYVAILE